jgi:peptidoglycan/LPS O-acetylase OafA/YrhL
MFMRYRADIDGLRAIAVLSVLFYHLGFEAFSGGFIGVDVFFVISGFLMTQIVTTEIRSNNFSFSAFYARRGRRILPALFVVTFATYVAAAMVFRPIDFTSLSAATLSAVAGGSNILFWNESGYFDVDANLKPLLHTWSLAVELQFYIVWPALILGVLIIRKLTLGIIVTGLISFIACWQIMKTDQSAAFFLTPFRIFEFALGGIVVVLPQIDASRRLAMDVIFGAGISVIMFAVFTYNKLTVFPGMAALAPCIGAAMALYAGSSARISFPLRLQPAVWIGKISYSLYLVHWPLIVFTLYVVDRPLMLQDRVLLLCAAFALAALSCYTVEVPLRRPLRRKHYGAIATVMLAFVAISTQSWATGGWTWRYPAPLRSIYNINKKEAADYVWANQVAHHKNEFSTNKPRLLVIGDSQAADITNVLVEGGYDKDYEIVTRTVIAECGIPYISPEKASNFWRTQDTFTMKDPAIITLCKGVYNTLLNTPALGQAEIIIVGYFWQEYSIPHFEDFLRELRARTKAPIYIFGNKQFGLWPEQMVAKLGGIDGFAAMAYDNRDVLGMSVARSIQQLSGPSYVDLMGMICPDRRRCLVLTDNNTPVYWGNTHFTKDGAIFLSRTIGNKMFEFLHERSPRLVNSGIRRTIEGSVVDSSR